MTLERIVFQFGYPALIMGLFLEGETILVLGGFMAHRGYLELPWVILIGMFVALFSDQFFFWLGRKRGNQFLENRPTWNLNIEKAMSMLEKNTNLVFFGFRFMYGLRTVIPFVIGAGRFDVIRFITLNFAGALLWALLFGMMGYAFGQVAETILEDIGKYELWIALSIAIIGAGVWLRRRYRSIEV